MIYIQETPKQTWVVVYTDDIGAQYKEFFNTFEQVSRFVEGELLS